MTDQEALRIATEWLDAHADVVDAGAPAYGELAQLIQELVSGGETR